MLDILTSLRGNYLSLFYLAFYSYLLFRFEIALLRHHVPNFEKKYHTIQDFLISLILKKSLAKSVEEILRYHLNKPLGGEQRLIYTTKEYCKYTTTLAQHREAKTKRNCLVRTELTKGAKPFRQNLFRTSGNYRGFHFPCQWRVSVKNFQVKT